MVKTFKDELNYINIFVILFKETDMRLDKVRLLLCYGSASVLSYDTMWVL